MTNHSHSSLCHSNIQLPISFISKKLIHPHLTYTSFFQNKEIVAQLKELDRITQAWMEFNYSLMQAQKTF